MIRKIALVTGGYSQQTTMKGFLAANAALGRAGQADGIGTVVAFRCSDDSKWVNGQRIEVSGGINL